ncbi:unnamed protein product [Caretta caretta]
MGALADLFLDRDDSLPAETQTPGVDQDNSTPHSSLASSGKGRTEAVAETTENLRVAEMGVPCSWPRRNEQSKDSKSHPCQYLVGWREMFKRCDDFTLPVSEQAAPLPSPPHAILEQASENLDYDTCFYVMFLSHQPNNSILICRAVMV